MQVLAELGLRHAAGAHRITEALPRLGEVHVWMGKLDEWCEADLPVGSLSRSEVARSHRFRFANDRARFVARRVFLREVLSRYLPSTAEGIRLTSTRQGKLQLSPPSDLQFNLSHSDGLALIAVAYRGRVGVDVERIRPLPEAQQIAEGFFTASEIGELRASGETQYARRFFTLWTRKEAYVKAVGGGLAIPLRSFDVAGNVAGNDAHTAMRIKGSRAGEVFSLVSVRIGDGLAAAVALEGERISVTTVRDRGPRR